MKKAELTRLHAALKGVQKHSGTKFSYAVAKNMKLIEDETKILQESLKPSEKFTEFETKRIEILKQHCDKNEDGTDLMLNGGTQFSLTKGMKKFEAEFNAVQEEYKEAIDEQEAKNKSFNEVLEEETDLVFHKIKVENIPESLTAEDVKSIFEIIAE